MYLWALYCDVEEHGVVEHVPDVLVGLKSVRAHMSHFLEIRRVVCT